MNGDTRAILDSLQEFRLEVVDRLARIEASAGFQEQRLTAYVAAEEDKIEALEHRLTMLTIDHAVAKQAGGRAGRKHASWVAGAIVAFTEVARAWLS